MTTPENLPPVENKSRLAFFTRPLKESLQRQFNLIREDRNYAMALGQVLFDVAVLGATAAILYQREGPKSVLLLAGGVYFTFRLFVFHIPKIAEFVHSHFDKNH